VSELDEAWAMALAEAEHRARTAGRGELADYLSLRNSNDLLRRSGIDWLLSSFTNLAGEANRVGASLQIASADTHRFKIGTSTMVGNLLTLSNGVRQLFIEAGWPRTPCDAPSSGCGRRGCRVGGEGSLPTPSDSRGSVLPAPVAAAACPGVQGRTTGTRRRRDSP